MYYLNNLISIFFVLAFLSPVFSSQILQVEDRPDELKALIDESYSNISSQQRGSWLYNGRYDYALFGPYDEEKIIRIIQTNPEQKEFYILDIGAGDFTWSKSMVKLLKESNEIHHDVSVTFLSITGETRNDGNEKIEEDNFTQHNLSAFKIENLAEELTALNLDFQFDLIVSAWCLIHLNDPVGVFLQCYNLLRPYTGVMWMHGFPVYLNESRKLNNADLARLLMLTGAPFLLEDSCRERNLFEFILLRINDDKLSLPLEYQGLVEEVDFCHIVKHDFASFRVLISQEEYEKYTVHKDMNRFFRNKYRRYFGTVEMFDWYKNIHLYLDEEGYFFISLPFNENSVVQSF